LRPPPYSLTFWILELSFFFPRSSVFYNPSHRFKRCSGPPYSRRPSLASRHRLPTLSLIPDSGCESFPTSCSVSRRTFSTVTTPFPSYPSLSFSRRVYFEDASEAAAGSLLVPSVFFSAGPFHICAFSASGFWRVTPFRFPRDILALSSASFFHFGPGCPLFLVRHRYQLDPPALCAYRLPCLIPLFSSFFLPPLNLKLLFFLAPPSVPFLSSAVSTRLPCSFRPSFRFSQESFFLRMLTFSHLKGFPARPALARQAGPSFSAHLPSRIPSRHAFPLKIALPRSSFSL